MEQLCISPSSLKGNVIVLKRNTNVYKTQNNNISLVCSIYSHSVSLLSCSGGGGQCTTINKFCRSSYGDLGILNSLGAKKKGLLKYIQKHNINPFKSVSDHGTAFRKFGSENQRDCFSFISIRILGVRMTCRVSEILLVPTNGYVIPMRKGRAPTWGRKFCWVNPSMAGYVKLVFSKYSKLL